MRGSALAEQQEVQVTSDVLSTRQVAQLLAVGEATVKRWADARELDCLRSQGGHRKFRLSDVTRFLHERQYEVSGGMPSSRTLELAENTQEAISALERAALDGDASACVAQLAALRLQGTSLAESFDDVVGPVLARLGVKAQKGQLAADEAETANTAITEAIARAQPLAEPPGEPVRADRGCAVVAAVASEQQDVASRMIACLLRARGFEVLAPLAQTPARDLAELIVRARSRIVCLSASPAARPTLVQEHVELAAEAVTQSGGILFCGGPSMAKLKLPTGARLLKHLTDLSEATAPRRPRHA